MGIIYACMHVYVLSGGGTKARLPLGDGSFVKSLSRSEGVGSWVGCMHACGKGGMTTKPSPLGDVL